MEIEDRHQYQLAVARAVMLELIRAELNATMAKAGAEKSIGTIYADDLTCLDVVGDAVIDLTCQLRECNEAIARWEEAHGL